jgi:23S rRNA (pseudouridine1915-N3)-methyltransferase
LKLSFVWIGRTKDRRLAELIGGYAERVRRYCKLEITELRETASDARRGTRERIDREGVKILEAIKPGVFRVAFDERGREMTSEGFAAFMGRAIEGTPAGVAMILGGPYGLSEAVLQGARVRCALSKMTLTHEMARLVAMDQVYRAFTILRGESYHH